jgi:hypothetical protein
MFRMFCAPAPLLWLSLLPRVLWPQLLLLLPTLWLTSLMLLLLWSMSLSRTLLRLPCDFAAPSCFLE